MLYLIVGTCMLSGCIEEYEAEVPAGDSDLLVVEGTICSNTVNKFYLSRTLPINSYEYPQIVGGAMLSVRGSDGSEYMADDYNGKYTCRVGELNPDATYYLHIEIEGEVYESEPQKPLRTEKIADVRGLQNTPEGCVDVLVTPASPFNPDQINYYSWTYDETWEVRPEYTTTMYFDVDTRKPVYQSNIYPVRGWKDDKGSTIMVGSSTNYEGQQIQRLKMYDIDGNDERIFFRYSGLVHQRAISKAEYEYETARRQAGSDMGGLFTPQPSALPTNIHCLTSGKRAIGFVGCALNTSDYRFFLEGENFTFYRPNIDTRIWLEDCNEDDCCRMVNRGYQLCVWEDSRENPKGYLTTAWATMKQLDVRYRDAYIEEPDFWKLKANVSY